MFFFIFKLKFTDFKQAILVIIQIFLPMFQILLLDLYKFIHYF